MVKLLDRSVIADTNSAKIGLNFNNCKSLKASNPFADNTGGFGLRLASSQFMRFFGATANICNGSSLVLDACVKCSFNGALIGGRKGLPANTPSIDAALVNGGSDINFDACDFVNATGHGLFSSGAPYVNVVSGSSADDIGRGIFTSGSSILKW